jgi:hypothetical protein
MMSFLREYGTLIIFGIGFPALVLALVLLVPLPHPSPTVNDVQIKELQRRIDEQEARQAKTEKTLGDLRVELAKNRDTDDARWDAIIIVRTADRKERRP